MTENEEMTDEKITERRAKRALKIATEVIKQVFEQIDDEVTFNDVTFADVTFALEAVCREAREWSEHIVNECSEGPPLAEQDSAFRSAIQESLDRQREHLNKHREDVMVERVRRAILRSRFEEVKRERE